jgi:hypothetical protein
MCAGTVSAAATICSAAATSADAPPPEAVVADEPEAVVADELGAVVAELVEVLEELHADSAPPIVTKATPAVNARVSLER